MPRFLKNLLIFSTLGLLACGAAAPLPPEDMRQTGDGIFRDGLWNSEFGDQGSVSILMEEVDGTISYRIEAGTDLSSSIIGSYLLDVPDADLVRFAFGAHNLGSATVTFRMMVQDGSRFEVLLEEEVSGQASRQDFDVVFTSFRGEAKTIFLEISTIDGSPLSEAVLIEAPAFLTQ